MALDGIGGGGAQGPSALERFQKLREAAQKKNDAPAQSREAAGKPDLAELIRSKQKELGTAGVSQTGAMAARNSAERIPPKPAAMPDNKNAAAALGGGAVPSAVYGRAGVSQKQDAAPRLGQYIDFRA